MAICGRCDAGYLHQEHRLGHTHDHLRWRGRLPRGAAGRKSLLLVFSPASGSVFTLLPPDNATGNFTKIIQRLPVRIRVPADVTERGALRPGMSVVATVDTKPGAVVAAGLALATQTAKK